MKKRLIQLTLLVLMIYLVGFMSGCSHTKPDHGYVSVDYIESNVIKKIDESVSYNQYHVKYLLNYFAEETEYLPKLGENELLNQSFIDSITTYSSSCVSLFLELPLHLTPTNWQVYVNEKLDNNLSTKYRLESKIYQAGSEYNYQIYYYQRAEGGFYLKTFGTNKALKINQLYEDFKIQCTGKWNITCEYDQDGFLVREEFATINAHQESDHKSVYGYAIYTYEK